MTNPRNLDPSEKWLRDGIALCHVPAYFQSLETDMSQAKELIETARRRNIRITYVHILARGTALALSANPELNQMVCGGRMHHPSQVDLALSVAGESIAAPLLVLEAADRKNIVALGEEITRRAPEVRDADREMLRLLRSWGWALPVSILRRGLLRFLFRNYRFRRKGAGTFQISVLPEIERAMSPVFSASAMLVAGAVKDRVVALNGEAVIRPVVTLTCCADHRIWDGRAGQKFLTALRQILESTRLLDEFLQASDNARPIGAASGS